MCSKLYVTQTMLLCSLQFHASITHAALMLSRTRRKLKPLCVHFVISELARKYVCPIVQSTRRAKSGWNSFLEKVSTAIASDASGRYRKTHSSWFRASAESIVSVLNKMQSPCKDARIAAWIFSRRLPWATCRKLKRWMPSCGLRQRQLKIH